MISPTRCYVFLEEIKTPVITVSGIDGLNQGARHVQKI